MTDWVPRHASYDNQLEHFADTLPLFGAWKWRLELVLAPRMPCQIAHSRLHFLRC